MSPQSKESLEAGNRDQEFYLRDGSVLKKL